ncbi:hypothetical protein RXE43_005732 [Pseudomonas aeruginosa]|uniref:PfkB family carbohydrate kinase n=1 Tax=Pseudomonas aeruginosa TaxID=287 RepID=UPI0003C3A5A3|nr:PfkB family carbohydrate kinase [Pseudomonas aeruginosa]ESR69775.1 carbohydrate kinase [Pseudomonas aeruginosa VRFPA05]EJV1367401.1 hypothetical protein [Pseudomonas aeruginosa]EJV1384117.1 hypothetical protein [Pseudomonas aeruginosa]EJV1607241.1 hypothetical protein [Pseudomonas aeruginosa]EKD1564149.1 hypothetical protein [Pseudomonas aeruginosa]
MWQQNRIVGTGLFALDVILGADSRRLGSALGGSTGNVLSILGALGWTATPVASFGQDIAGERLCNELQSIGADLRFVDRSSAQRTNVIYQHQLPTSRNGSATHRFSFACPCCGKKHHPVVEFDGSIVSKALEGQAQTDVFYLDRPTRAGYELAKSYHESGALVVFEPSGAGDDPTLFEAILRHAHIVKYADERFKAFSFDMPSSVLVEIQTLGASGLRFRSAATGRAWRQLPAFAVPHVEDTSGAGDWCTAGLVYALLQKCSRTWHDLREFELEHALAFGQALSSLNCLTRGARGLLKILTPAEILSLAWELCADRANQQGPLGTKQFGKLTQQKAQTLTLEGHDAPQDCCSAKT